MWLMSLQPPPGPAFYTRFDPGTFVSTENSKYTGLWEALNTELWDC